MTKVKTKKQTPKKTLATSVKILPVAEMKVSKLNMRHGKKAPDIDDIYPSILKSGINQSLLVRKEGGKWGVIAGRRRLFALKKKAKETGQAVKAPCVVMESGNAKAAKEASLLENVARVPATMLEQFAAYKGLADSGQSIEDIASIFVIEPKQVKRILALANLNPEILALYESEDIRQPTVRALTLATPEQQMKWLELFKNEDEYAPQGGNLKDWLTGGAQIETKAAIFDLESFDGTIITDLFGDTDYFADPDQFWPLQNGEVAKLKDMWLEAGWNEVVIMERGDYFDSYEHGERSMEQGGKIYVRIGHDGTVKPYIGYLPQSDIKKIETILGVNGEGEAKKSTQKPEMSGPMKQYIALHRHGAIRSELLNHPQVALRLTVATMLTGGSNFKVTPQVTKSRKESVTESVAASAGAKIFETERTAIYALLETEQATGGFGGPPCCLTSGDTHDVFARLLKLDDAEVMRVMTFAMCESLSANEAVVEAITYAVPVDMTSLWSPDDTFFELLRDKAMINAMVKDIAGIGAADANLTETGKVQKAIIREALDGTGTRKHRPDWRPKWMQTPASYYNDKTTCPPAQADSHVSKAMMAGVNTEKKKAA